MLKKNIFAILNIILKFAERIYDTDNYFVYARKHAKTSEKKMRILKNIIQNSRKSSEEKKYFKIIK